MASYAVELRRSAVKELGDLASADVGRVISRIRALGTNPRPQGSEKLTGAEQYRVRQGLYRILYEVDDVRRIVTIVKIGHRREVYR
ncbi:MAG TPA: type II toxin-antitoxin system RelE/ParE family toxin [Polyangiaceae bacterium]|nr:type II toxin-antitoxin system RelE/ParE family toxin [Polyangiaceae bacterium]